MAGDTAPLAMTMGDPAGIGPEVALAAWRDRAPDEAFVVFAAPGLLAAAAKRAGLTAPIIETDRFSVPRKSAAPWASIYATSSSACSRRSRTYARCTESSRRLRRRKGPARGGVLDGAGADVARPVGGAWRRARTLRAHAVARPAAAVAPQSDRRGADLVAVAGKRPALCRPWLQAAGADRTSHQRFRVVSAQMRHRSCCRLRRARSGDASARRETGLAGRACGYRVREIPRARSNATWRRCWTASTMRSADASPWLTKRKFVRRLCRARTTDSNGLALRQKRVPEGGTRWCAHSCWLSRSSLSVGGVSTPNRSQSRIVRTGSRAEG